MLATGEYVVPSPLIITNENRFGCPPRSYTISATSPLSPIIYDQYLDAALPRSYPLSFLLTEDGTSVCNGKVSFMPPSVGTILESTITVIDSSLAWSVSTPVLNYFITVTGYVGSRSIPVPL